MTVKECYEKMGANYEDVIEHLVSDKLVYKYNKKFSDSKDCGMMLKHLEEEDYEEAFRMIHSIKGMCLNLSYTKLYDLSSDLCEALRDGKPQGDIAPVLNPFLEEYRRVVFCIEEMDEVV